MPTFISFSHKTSLIATACLLMLTLSVFPRLAMAQELEYDGTTSPGKALLEPANSIVLPYWMGYTTEQGLIFRSSATNTVTTNADLLVNYAAGIQPSFAISGYSNSGGNVENNKMSVRTGAISGDVYGGVSHLTEAISDDILIFIDIHHKENSTKNNEVLIEGSAQNVYGGYSTITVHLGSLTTPLNIGGNQASMIYSSQINANDNTVRLGDSALAADIYGGYASVEQSSGTLPIQSNDHNVTANAFVHISNSEINANNNTIHLGNNASAADIYGGYAMSNLSGASTAISTTNTNGWKGASGFSGANQFQLSANSNTVYLEDGASVSEIYGGYAAVHLTAGDASAYHYAESSLIARDLTLSASNNEIYLGDGVLSTSIYGGYTGIHAKAGTATSTVSADSRINVSNSTFSSNANQISMNGILSSGAIYGGYVYFDILQGSAVGATAIDSVDLTSTTAQAINNTLSMGDNAVVSNASSSLYGGYLDFNAGSALKAYDLFTGNMLNFSAQPASVHTVANFEYYNFVIPAIAGGSTTPLITGTDIYLDSTGAKDASQPTVSSKIEVVGIQPGSMVCVGDQFILMQATNSLNGTAQTVNSTITQGISLEYDVEVAQDDVNKQVTATIVGSRENGGGHVNPQLQALSEGVLAGLMLNLHGADRVANDLLDNIYDVEDYGIIPFISISADYNRYNSGSHIDSDSLTMAGGLSYRNPKGAVAVFAEGGWGNYDSYNSFYNALDVHGRGNTEFYGIGILAQYQMDNGLYLQGSLRGGKTRISFDSFDIISAQGLWASYNIKSDYIGAHAGVGYVFDIDQKNSMDLSLKYLWTQLEGNDLIVAGDAIHFDTMDSQRIRAMAKWNYQYSEQNTFNVALGYEYEMDAKVGATTYSVYQIEAPDMKGSTGIIQVGANIKPSSTSSAKGLSIDLNARGSIGKREGVGATVQLNYAF